MSIEIERTLVATSDLGQFVEHVVERCEVLVPLLMSFTATRIGTSAMYGVVFVFDADANDHATEQRLQDLINHLAQEAISFNITG